MQTRSDSNTGLTDSTNHTNPFQKQSQQSEPQFNFKPQSQITTSANNPFLTQNSAGQPVSSDLSMRKSD